MSDQPQIKLWINNKPAPPEWFDIKTGLVTVPPGYPIGSVCVVIEQSPLPDNLKDKP